MYWAIPAADPLGGNRDRAACEKELCPGARLLLAMA